MQKKYNYNIINILKDKENFVSDILKKTLFDISKMNEDKKVLRESLYESLIGEKKLFTKQRWYADSSSEKIFKKGGLFEQLKDENNDLNEVVSKIIESYIQEISNDFDPSVYNLLKSINYFFFSRLLNSVKIQLPNEELASERGLSSNQISILGNIKLIQKLAKQGTLIVVPTHFSNLDSLLIGMVLDSVDLQPVIYGAGLNLFNNVTNGLLNKVGAYKIDRRKKNLIYLTTLQNYSTLAIHYGCDCLFFPGGTRIRSGEVETKLKFGLLRTTVAAQALNYKKHGLNAKKIYIVPLIVNYPFVLEGASLIREHIKKTYGVDIKNKKTFGERYISFFKNTSDLIFKKSKITVSFGDPIDVLGNRVDESGSSMDVNGTTINLFSILEDNNLEDGALLRETSKNLSQNIMRQYRTHNVVIPSSLVAFVAFEILLSMYRDLSMSEFFQLPKKAFKINAYLLAEKIKVVREVILDYEENDLIDISDEIRCFSIDDIIKDGLENLGIYGSHRPLVLEKYNFYTTEDICSLFYYHNRLVGYELEKFIV